MQCSKCKGEAVIFQPYSGQHLCRDHFIDDLEAKAKRSIRVHQWMKPGDHIGVLVTGSVADNALLFFLQKLTGNRRDVRISAHPACRGTPGYKRILGDAGMTKVALATTLEDAAASVLTSILQGEPDKDLLSGSDTGITLPLIAPFSHIPAYEIAAYARLHGLSREETPDPQERDPLFTEMKAMLIDYSRRHPAAPHAVLNLFEVLGNTGYHNHSTYAGEELP